MTEDKKLSERWKGAVEDLKEHQNPADQEGICVIVSRQALEETLDYVADLEKRLGEAEEESKRWMSEHDKAAILAADYIWYLSDMRELWLDAVDNAVTTVRNTFESAAIETWKKENADLRARLQQAEEDAEMWRVMMRLGDK